MLLQEHSFTPANMYNFDRNFPDCFNFGCSAMRKCVESGILTGRTFGGVVTLINNNLRKITETVKYDDRLVIIRTGNLLFVDVYLPCISTVDRLEICESIFLEVEYCRERFPGCHCVIAV